MSVSPPKKCKWPAWYGKVVPTDIAVAIGTTEQLVRNYLRNTFDKLGVWSRLELALYVASHGGAHWNLPSEVALRTGSEVRAQPV